MMSNHETKESLKKQSEYSDLSRALLMARSMEDTEMVVGLLKEVDVILDSNPVDRLIMLGCLVNLSHSCASGMAALLDIEIADIVLMDATAQYHIEAETMNNFTDEA